MPQHGTASHGPIIWRIWKKTESLGQRSAAYAVEISKARQLDLFERCGVGYPRARVLNHQSRVREQRGLQFPSSSNPTSAQRRGSFVRLIDQLAGAIRFRVDGTRLSRVSSRARRSIVALKC